jgi:uncharacterized protein
VLKAVIDTSVFVAGYLSRTAESPSAQVITRWRNGEFTLVISRQILEEIAAKFIELGISDECVLEFVTFVATTALMTPGHVTVYRLDKIDPDDNMLLAAAQEGQADYLVSLDGKHLLPLKHHYRTQIVLPYLFIRALDCDTKDNEITSDAKTGTDAAIHESEAQRHGTD